MKKTILVSALVLLGIGTFAQKGKNAPKDSISLSIKVDSSVNFINEYDFTNALIYIQREFGDRITLKEWDYTIRAYELLKMVARKRKQK